MKLDKEQMEDEVALALTIDYTHCTFAEQDDRDIEELLEQCRTDSQSETGIYYDYENAVKHIDGCFLAMHHAKANGLELRTTEELMDVCNFFTWSKCYVYELFILNLEHALAEDEE